MRRPFTYLLTVLALVIVVLGGLVRAEPADAATPIDTKYAQLGGSASKLGAAVGPEVCGLRNGGCFRDYQRGAIVWSSATGAQPSWGAIRDAWRSAGFEDGGLAYPTGPEVCGLRDGGCYQNFQGGAIVWSPATGARVSVGDIRRTWGALGFEAGRLGYPTTNEICGLRGGGCYQNYQDGAIIWSPTTGAQTSWGAIRSAWQSTSFENGALGYPVTSEACSASGCSQQFQRGSISWSPSGGTRISREIDVAASANVVVNKLRALNPARYGPTPLMSVEGAFLRNDAAQQFSTLLMDARAAGIGMVPISGYRSYDTQASLYASYVNQYGQAGADLISARPGHSEHQTGLAIDIGNASGACALQECFAGTPAGAWAEQNAWRYGFIVRYPRGETPVTGYAYEPWHLRYVGTTISTEMRAGGQRTLEQYMSLPAAPGY